MSVLGDLCPDAIQAALNIVSMVKKDQADSNALSLSGKIDALGMLKDGIIEPSERPEVFQEETATDVISQHAIEMTLHIVSDPKKIKRIQKGTFKIKDKIAQYCKKVYDGIHSVSDNLETINNEQAMADPVSQRLHQATDASTLDPRAEAAAILTEHALKTPRRWLRATDARTDHTVSLHREMRAIRPKREVPIGTRRAKPGQTYSYSGTI